MVDRPDSRRRWGGKVGGGGFSQGPVGSQWGGGLVRGLLETGAYPGACREQRVCVGGGLLAKHLMQMAVVQKPQKKLVPEEESIGARTDISLCWKSASQTFPGETP